jgi:hypothetical protein
MTYTLILTLRRNTDYLLYRMAPECPRVACFLCD